MNMFFQSEACSSRFHCKACRGSKEFRGKLVAIFQDIETPDFDCPYGIGTHNTPTPHKVVEVPPAVLQMDMQGLYGEILKIADQETRQRGLALWQEESGKIAEAACTDCQRNHAAAKVRVWLSKNRGDA
jgi:hypothetical protein